MVIMGNVIAITFLLDTEFHTEVAKLPLNIPDVYKITSFEIPDEDFWTRFYAKWKVIYPRCRTKRPYLTFSLKEVFEAFIDFYAEMNFQSSDVRFPEGTLNKVNEAIDGFYGLNDLIESNDFENIKIRLNKEAFEFEIKKFYGDKFLERNQILIAQANHFHCINIACYKSENFDNDAQLEFLITEKDTGNTLFEHWFEVTDTTEDGFWDGIHLNVLFEKAIELDKKLLGIK